MNLDGQPIRHRAFGSGVVTALTDSTITVRFPAGEKKFIYPDAFSEHLVFANGEIQRDITARLAEREAELRRRRQREAAEHERRRRLLRFQAAANSHAVFDVAPEDAARVCADFTVSAGKYLSGYSRGKPRVMEKLKPNSACLLTERPAGEPEPARRVIGAFMVPEDYFGEDSDTGLVQGHPQYRLALPQGESLLFWEYFGPDAAPRWGSTAFKYCSAAVMNRILSELVQMLRGTAQEDSALAFYRYFCRMNKLRALPVPGPAEPAG